MKAYIFALKNSTIEADVVSFLSTMGVACSYDMDAADFTIVLGGDGSVLAAGRKGVPNPILVINTGHLGFLTSTDKENYQEAIKSFLQGSYTLTKRRTLRVRVVPFRPLDKFREYNAVNEVVISKNQLAKLVKVGVYVMDRDGPDYQEPGALDELWRAKYDFNRTKLGVAEDKARDAADRTIASVQQAKLELVCEYRADGLIVSTPTGSTAYNLSAGGPIIHPSCENIVITPICPQGLSQRPLVLSNDVRIRIKPLSDDLYVSVDGQEICPMHGNVDVFCNSHRMEIVNPSFTYYQILRQKLGWGVKLV
jgi:NAD+ kinase